jgi:hypothetical protein
VKKQDVQVGKRYIAKISGKLTTVRLTSISSYGGWNAVNVATGRAVRIRTAAKLRKPAGVVLVADTNRALNFAVQSAVADLEKAEAVSSFGAGTPNTLGAERRKELALDTGTRRLAILTGGGKSLAALDGICKLVTGGIGVDRVVDAVVTGTQDELMQEVSRNIREEHKGFDFNTPFWRR